MNSEITYVGGPRRHQRLLAAPTTPPPPPSEPSMVDKVVAVPAAAVSGLADFFKRNIKTGGMSRKPLPPSEEDEISGLGSFIKKAAKGTVKVAKGGNKVLTQNPLSRTLIAQVPGGASALSAVDYGKNLAKVITAGKKGNPKAVAAIKDVKTQAAAGDSDAQAALKAMQNVNALTKKKPSRYRRAVQAGMAPGVYA